MPNGFRDALGNIFKSKDDRERNIRRRRRRKFRDAERMVDSLKDRVGGLKKERQKSWEEARKHMSEGDKFAARSALRNVRQCEVLAAKTQTKYFVCRSMHMELENAQTDADFQQIFGGLTKVLDIDVAKTEDVMEDVKDNLSEVREGDKIWQRMNEKMTEEQSAVSLEIPSLEELEKQLEDEAAEMIPERGEKEKEANQKTKAKEKIESAEQRLKKLMKD